MHCMTQALSHRHREKIGAKQKSNGRIIFSWFLRAPQSTHDIFLGPNASTMLDRLATLMFEKKWIQNSDEIIIAMENHRANVDPWLRLAQCGVNICWWKSYKRMDELHEDNEMNLLSLLSPKTRLVCLSHASNILGSVRDIHQLCSIIREYERTRHVRIHVLVDGVGTTAHLYPNVAGYDVDWYVTSSHKMFGPTMGILCGKKVSVQNLFPSFNAPMYFNAFEPGTANYEGCAGIQGLWLYFSQLALLHSSIIRDEPYQDPAILNGNQPLPESDTKAMKLLHQAYECIALVESPLYCMLLDKLATCPNLILIRDTADHSHGHIPLVCFVHKTLSHSDIVQYCSTRGIIARFSTFLATEQFLQGFGILDEKNGFVRVSLCHYNTLYEVEQLLVVLESMDGW